jgi:hypothetical protein
MVSFKLQKVQWQGAVHFRVAPETIEEVWKGFEGSKSKAQ